MKRILIVASCVSVLGAAPAFAQYPKSPKPASSEPAGEPTKAKAAAGMTAGSLHRMTPDGALVVAMAQSGYDGLTLGKLGTQKASSPEVRKFAQEILDSSQKLSDDMKPMLKAGNMETPASLGQRHQATYDWLTKLSGADFDRAFTSDMASSYSNDVLMLQRASTMARDENVKTWATKALPGAQAHEQAAKDLMQKLTATK